jgi:hypothetical protein
MDSKVPSSNLHLSPIFPYFHKIQTGHCIGLLNFCIRLAQSGSTHFNGPFFLNSGSGLLGLCNGPIWATEQLERKSNDRHQSMRSPRRQEQHTEISSRSDHKWVQKEETRVICNIILGKIA